MADIKGDDDDNERIGGDDNDSIEGLGGNDTLYGMGGNDWIDGGSGNDSLFGGEGNDNLVGGPGDDRLDGGAHGSGDSAHYRSSPSGVNVNLATGIAFDGFGGQDTLIDVEHIWDSPFDDVLTGNAVSNWFRLGAGDDVVDGAGGSDVVMYEDAKSGVTVDLLAGTATGTAIGTDKLTSIEAVHGSQFDDVVTLGENGGGYVFSRAGNDQLFGGSKDESFIPGSGNDTVNGGGGFDIVDYPDDGADAAGPIKQGIHVDLNAGFAIDGWGGKDVLSSIEGITGTHLNDTLIGSAAGENFNGGKGDDTIDGGGGTDRAVYDRADGPVTVSLATGTSSGADGNDKLSNFENLRGSAFGDTLTGDNAANNIQGRAGNDTIFGGGGNDNLQGEDGDDELHGGDGNDALSGGNGNDLIDGGAGSENLFGNAGSDTLIGGDGDDQLFGYDSGSGLDPQGLDGADLLQSGAGNDVLRGNSGNDTLEGGDGDDNLRGDAGDDLVDGGDGSDIASYRFDEVKLATGVTFDASSVGTAPMVLLPDGLGGTDTLISIERILITGSGFADKLIGTPGNDQISGSGGDDQVFGGDGNDNLRGDAGNDSVDGGDGKDFVVFVFAGSTAGVSFDGSAVGTAPTVTIDDGLGGQDTLTSIEALNIQGTEFNDTLKVGQGDDTILGFGGNDWLYGEGGNDSLQGGAGNDSVRGGEGDDQLLGEDGDDVLWGDAGNDTLDGGAGFDIADYDGAAGPVSVDLAQGKASGADGDDVLTSMEGIIGSEFADTLTGDGIDNFFRGRKGDDTIDGGGGNDRAAYDRADGPVTVSLMTGTSTGADGNDKLINIENLRGSDFADTLTGNDAANNIQGRAGNDTIFGNGGDDFLAGEDGDDLIDGGAGLDTADYFFFGHKAAIVADLSKGLVTGGAGLDTLVGIEYVNGTNFDDLFIGDALDNIFWGNGGNDTLDGGAGGDMAYYSRATGGVNVDLSQGKASGADGDDVLISIEFATGSNFDDVLIGDGGGNFLRGLKGNDFIDGGAGIDRAAYDFATGAVTVNLAAGTATGADGNDTLSGIEYLRGSNFGDLLIGDESPNNIQARGGDDTVHGGGGDDTLIGEGGNDSIYGEAGNDVVSGEGGNDAVYGGDGDDSLYGGPGDDILDGGAQSVLPGRITYDFVQYEFTTGPMVVNLATGKATGEGNDVLIGIEGIVGSAFADTFIGDANDNWFIGNAGDDQIDGGAGIDGVEYRHAPGAVTVDLMLGKASGGHGNDVLAGIEWVEGSAFDDMLTGAGSDDFLRGGPGNDTLDGGGGSDRADYRRAPGSVFVNLAAGLATGADGNDVLKNFENARGSDSFADTLIGAADANLLEGRGGDDLLLGLAGDDVLDGGDGIDTAFFAGNRAAYTIQLNSGSGNLQAAALPANSSTWTVTGPDGTDTVIAVERLQFADLTVVFDIDGNAGQGYRLYQAAFARTPDTPGLSFWINALDSGFPLIGVAQEFLASAEFQSKYGTNPSDVEFITLLYLNVLGRLPDQAGYDFWLNALATGAITRAGMLIEFSESGENKANLLPVLQNGIGYQPLTPISGGPGNDSLPGTASADWLLGQGGRDLLTGGAGNDLLDGGADLDTAALSGQRGRYTVVAQGGNLMVIDNGGVDGIDTLIDVERLQFTDVNLAFDIGGNAGQGYRLYQAAFDRTPDRPGLSFWIGALDGGAALLDVAQAFLGSAEFQNLYGANPTNVEFITLLYQNVLNRLPDQDGYDFWLGAMANGLTRAGVLVEFSESGENQANLIGVLQQGIEYMPVV